MKAEIHYRPLMMPYVRGEKPEEHPYEVDLWVYPEEGIGQVLIEYVVKDNQAAIDFIWQLKKALQNVDVIYEAE